MVIRKEKKNEQKFIPIVVTLEFEAPKEFEMFKALIGRTPSNSLVDMSKGSLTINLDEASKFLRDIYEKIQD